LALLQIELAEFGDVLGAEEESVRKELQHGIVEFELSSAAASPTPVAAKLLLSDHITCGLSAVSGAHHASAIT